MPNVSNAEVLDSAYQLRDALIPYIRILVTLLEESGVSEKERNIQLYKLMEKLGTASDGFPPGVVTLTLAYALNKLLDQIIQSSTPKPL